MVKGIGHVAFYAADMEKSLNFYCNVLGLTDAFAISDDEGRPWIRYIKICEGQFIELFYGAPKEMAGYSYSHLCLEVDDIYEVAEKIRSNGLTLDVEPKRGKDLNYQCWVRDPDGNRIEFMQIDPESPQRKNRSI